MGVKNRWTKTNPGKNPRCRKKNPVTNYNTVLKYIIGTGPMCDLLIHTYVSN